MTRAPKRRWFRWSVRTLFVVVTVCAAILSWSAYCWNWIGARHAAVSSTEPPWDVPRAVVGSDEGTAPALLWLFGARGYDRMRVVFDEETDEAHLSTQQKDALSRIRRLYPEANVVVCPPFDGTPL